MIRAGREKPQSSMGPSPVVVAAVLREDGPQVSFAEDQDAVGEFGSGAVADEEPEGGGAVVEVHEQVAGLLGGPRSGRMAGRPEDVHVAVTDLQCEEHIDP